MQEQILERYPEAELRVYVVWLPVMPLDSRFEVADVMVDPRSSHYWDEEQLVSDELARALGSQGLVWDAFLVFGPNAVWDERPPKPVETGAPVVARMASLEAALRPFLD